MKHIASYFEGYPYSNQAFETSDNTLFHSEVDAKNHAVSLKDKDIKTHKRPAPETAEKPATQKNAEPAADGDKTTEAAKGKKGKVEKPELKVTGSEIPAAQ
jgi:phosphoketolase